MLDTSAWIQNTSRKSKKESVRSLFSLIFSSNTHEERITHTTHVFSRMCTTLGLSIIFHYKLLESLSHSLKQSSYRPIMSVKQFNHLPRSKVPVQRMMNIFLKDISSILEMNLSALFNYWNLNYHKHSRYKKQSKYILPLVE